MAQIRMQVWSQLQCKRFNFSKKNFIIVLIIILFIFFRPFLIPNTNFCDPEKQLWWFCSWPDPRQTVCSWKNHFPSLHSENNSYDRMKENLFKMHKVQRHFEFNNLTLERCQETSIDLLIFIISKCSHASTRLTIRRTWGHWHTYQTYFPTISIKFLFLLDFNQEYQRRIELEHEIHQDIVQVMNLPEQYEYVTYREAAMYTFVHERCQHMKYLLKTDDDIFLNLFVLLKSQNKYFLNMLSKKNQMILYGYPIQYGLVVRSTPDLVGQRYIITKDEYSCPRYPTFLSGFAYLLSFQTLSFLLALFQRDSEPFILSDVYFTGLLPELFNIPRISISNDISYLYQRSCYPQFFLATSEPLACAATDQHFHSSSSLPSNVLINEYNSFWDILKHRYL